jgi:Protein of unknown function (DUF2591)
MRVDDLTGAALDYYVARAEGLMADLIRANGMAYCRVDVPHQGYLVYVPTHNWQLLGAIVKRQKYLIYPRLDNESGETIWLAEAQLNASFHGAYIADGPELALCRLRVAEAFGEVVPCP